MGYRAFSSSGETPPPDRTIDSEAPESLRNELVDLAFSLGVEAGLEEVGAHPRGRR